MNSNANLSNVLNTILSETAALNQNVANQCLEKQKKRQRENIQDTKEHQEREEYNLIQNVQHSLKRHYCESMHRLFVDKQLLKLGRTKVAKTEEYQVKLGRINLLIRDEKRLKATATKFQKNLDDLILINQ